MKEKNSKWIVNNIDHLFNKNVEENLHKLRKETNPYSYKEHTVHQRDKYMEQKSLLKAARKKPHGYIKKNPSK